jgi:hypothetical protein
MRSTEGSYNQKKVASREATFFVWDEKMLVSLSGRVVCM